MISGAYCNSPCRQKFFRMGDMDSQMWDPCARKARESLVKILLVLVGKTNFYIRIKIFNCPLNRNLKLAVIPTTASLKFLRHPLPWQYNPCSCAEISPCQTLVLPLCVENVMDFLILNRLSEFVVKGIRMSGDKTYITSSAYPADIQRTVYGFCLELEFKI